MNPILKVSPTGGDPIAVGLEGACVLIRIKTRDNTLKVGYFPYCLPLPCGLLLLIKAGRFFFDPEAEKGEQSRQTYKTFIMASKKKFSTESTVFVSVPSKLSLEQTQHVTAEILRIAGCPTCYSGFKFQFIDEAELISVTAGESNSLSVSALN
jgi:hypothetical protein